MDKPECRMKAWRENQAKSGKKRVEIYLTEEAHEELKAIRQETRESYGKIIGDLLLFAPRDRPGIKTLTLEISTADYEDLEREHGDLKLILEQIIREKAEALDMSGADF